MPTYNNNIPQPPDRLYQSQPSLLDNFQVLDANYTIDHYTFSNTTGQLGKHKSVHMPAASDIATGSGEVVLYSKVGPTNPELFFRQQSNATVIQMTYAAAKMASSNRGQSFLPCTPNTDGNPGPILIKFGQDSFSGANLSVNILYAASLDNFPTNTVNVVATPFGAAATLYVSAFTATGFTVNRASGSISGLTFQWIAIGK